MGSTAEENQFRKISNILQEKRLAYLGHLLREPDDEATKQATFYKTNAPNIGHRRRAGKPRINLTIAPMEEAWNKNMADEFSPAWINVLDESMMEWFGSWVHVCRS